MTIQKRTLLRVFRRSVVKSDINVTVVIKDQKVCIRSGNAELEYAFQLSQVASYLFSPTSHRLLAEYIKLTVENKPILIEATLNAIPSLLAQQVYFSCGRLCFMVHPTISTSVPALPRVISALARLSITVCISENQIFELRQMFELAIFARTHFFCTVTANRIPTILYCGKKRLPVEALHLIAHTQYIAKYAYPDQPQEMEFISEDLDPHVHPFQLERILQNSISKDHSSLDMSFVRNLRMFLSPETFEKARQGLMKMPKSHSKSTLQFSKAILSTQDFLQGVEIISGQFQRGKGVMLVAAETRVEGRIRVADEENQSRRRGGPRRIRVAGRRCDRLFHRCLSF
jgi:hypothetical protein